ncbi:MAG: hypothetical protein QM772_02185 [Ottowia sp.]|uniref:hypothetical protein n=1 Tax=Ottowia sp. TaxID=1898956 RepID=UPI0039E710E6
MDMISLDAAVALTGISRSTLWRRVTDGRIGKGGKDARGRATLALADVLPLVSVPLGPEDVQVLLQADAGAAEAQADLGALCYVAGAEKAALYWLNEAAAQGHADAMHWLGIAHYAGSGGGGGGGGESLRERERQDNLAIMWIARAAALGHPLAQRQMAGLRGRGGRG